MTTPRRPWTRAEQLTVLRYYLQTQFGRLHASNPEIESIASRLGRTPSSIAMKGSNYASLDPKIIGSGRKGLSQASQLDRDVWDFMRNYFEEFEQESAVAAAQFGLDPSSLTPKIHQEDSSNTPVDSNRVTEGPTETSSTVTVRRKQDFFRRTLLNAYRNTCPISGISLPELITASHIIPWSVDEKRRLDPTNGIALNALHDRAFDRGLISFQDDLTVLVSSRIRTAPMPEVARDMIQGVEGMKAARPDRFNPDPVALEFHRDSIFIH